MTLPGWQGGCLRSPIPREAGVWDAIGPWPYGSPPEVASLARARDRLREAGVTAFRALLRPRASVSVEAFVAAGFQVTPVKDHYVHTPGIDLPSWSARTRRNMRRARAGWRVEEVSLEAHQTKIVDYHEALLTRKKVGAIASLPPEHFRVLAKLPGFVTLGAFDGEGLGAALIVARHGREVHFHTLVAADRAAQTGGCYALFDAALRLWGGSFTLYLGGMPSGPDGPGVGRFKGRFATGTVQTYMVTAVVDRQRYDRLTSTWGPHPWFPSYREPGS